MSIQQEKFKIIADKIREKTGVAEPIKPNDFSDKIEDVYNAGKKSQYDEFWDNFQDFGNRTDYRYAFRSIGWTDKNFKPKYKISPTNCSYMFNYSNITEPDMLAEYVDFTNCQDATGLFAWSKFERLPILNFVNVTSASSIFAATVTLEVIDKIIINSDGSFPFAANTFNSSTKLKEVCFEGVIGTSFYIQHCEKLSKDSIINIIEALSETTSGLSASFSKNAVNTAFETADGARDGSSSAEWLELIATKPNWTISLV